MTSTLQFCSNVFKGLLPVRGAPSSGPGSLGDSVAFPGRRSGTEQRPEALGWSINHPETEPLCSPWPSMEQKHPVLNAGSNSACRGQAGCAPTPGCVGSVPSF